MSFRLSLFHFARESHSLHVGGERATDSVVARLAPDCSADEGKRKHLVYMWRFSRRASGKRYSLNAFVNSTVRRPSVKLRDMAG